MTAKDHQKLLNIGFSILRRDIINLKIKIKTPMQREWHLFKESFTNINQLNKRMDELLTDNKIIQD